MQTAGFRKERLAVLAVFGYIMTDRKLCSDRLPGPRNAVATGGGARRGRSLKASGKKGLTIGVNPIVTLKRVLIATAG